MDDLFAKRVLMASTKGRWSSRRARAGWCWEKKSMAVSRPRQQSASFPPASSLTSLRLDHLPHVTTSQSPPPVREARVQSPARAAPQHTLLPPLLVSPLLSYVATSIVLSASPISSHRSPTTHPTTTTTTTTTTTLARSLPLQRLSPRPGSGPSYPLWASPSNTLPRFRSPKQLFHHSDRPRAQTPSVAISGPIPHTPPGARQLPFHSPYSIPSTPRPPFHSSPPARHSNPNSPTRPTRDLPRHPDIPPSTTTQVSRRPRPLSVRRARQQTPPRTRPARLFSAVPRTHTPNTHSLSAFPSFPDFFFISRDPHSSLTPLRLRARPSICWLPAAACRATSPGSFCSIRDHPRRSIHSARPPTCSPVRPRRAASGLCALDTCLRALIASAARSHARHPLLHCTRGISHADPDDLQRVRPSESQTCVRRDVPPRRWLSPAPRLARARVQMRQVAIRASRFEEEEEDGSKGHASTRPRPNIRTQRVVSCRVVSFRSRAPIPPDVMSLGAQIQKRPRTHTHAPTHAHTRTRSRFRPSRRASYTIPSARTSRSPRAPRVYPRIHACTCALDRRRHPAYPNRTASIQSRSISGTLASRVCRRPRRPGVYRCLLVSLD